jgi:uncharacterized protein YcaQ
MYLTFPRAQLMDRRRVLEELLASGEVVELDVVSANPSTSRAARWYALRRDLPALAEAAEERAPSRGTTLLTPFDSLLWYRERAERLFGFEYRIEVYTPREQRAHGYYVLPILHDGQLIGRVDAKNHRDTPCLELKHVHFEPWFVAKSAPPGALSGLLDRDAALAGLVDALRSLATFLGASRIRCGRVSPASLRRRLQGLLRASADDQDRM